MINIIKKPVYAVFWYMKHPGFLNGTWLIPLACTLLFLSLHTPSIATEKKVVSPERIEGATKVSAENLIELANSLNDLALIDARIKSDRKQGFIPDSISLPDTETNCQSLRAHVRSFRTPVLFYCNGPKCGRSDKAVRIAMKCGYINIYWFRGGFEEWLDKNYIVHK